MGYILLPSIRFISINTHNTSINYLSFCKFIIPSMNFNCEAKSIYGRNFDGFLSFAGRYLLTTKSNPCLANACCSTRTPIFSI